MPRTFGSLSSYEPGLMDQARWWLQDKLTPVMGGDARRAGDFVQNKVMPTAEYLPGVGDAMAAGEAVDYFKQGQPIFGTLAAAGAAAGLVPGVGDAVQKGSRKLVDALEQSAKSRGVDLSLSQRGNQITVNKIVVPESQRNQGIGSGIMREIVDAADANQMNLALTPSSDFGGNKRKLEEFYTRFGFEPNAGRSRDYEISETMRRYAQQPQKPQGIRAYHGSPHDFDKFSLDKIGTGEGAQAYGHGLYFAENEGVARAYRDILGRYHDTVDIDGKSIPLDEAIKMAMPGGEGVGYAKYIQKQRNKLDIDSFNDFIEREVVPDIRVGLGRVSEDQIGTVMPVNGRMYEVNINADPNDFLDWDKPLSEQPWFDPRSADEIVAQVKAEGREPTAIEKLNVLAKTSDWGNKGSATGQNMLSAMGEERLKKAGIPGIKYLDAGSRSAGDGSRNYVVFDDALIEILRKYGLAGLGIGVGAGGFGSLAPQDDNYQPPQL